jgi:regulator of cell morphogenesis and NO signaling
MPVIEAHLTKVAAKHGSSFPYMKKVLELFSYLKNDMNLHLQKEEMILFPGIKAIAAGNKQQTNISNPIAIMLQEHDEAGEIMEKIRILTNDYQAPEKACNTFKIVLEELKKFEPQMVWWLSKYETISCNHQKV